MSRERPAVETARYECKASMRRLYEPAIRASLLCRAQVGDSSYLEEKGRKGEVPACVRGVPNSSSSILIVVRPLRRCGGPCHLRALPGHRQPGAAWQLPLSHTGCAGAAKPTYLGVTRSGLSSLHCSP